jgi:outer membrane protein TolC
MKQFTLLIFLLFTSGIMAQSPDEFTLESLQQDAVKNYPLLKQKGLLDESNDLAIKNINTAWLPQFQINGQATYQSSVPTLPIDIPHVKIPTLDRDHYQLTLDGQQTIYDGGTIKNQKDLQLINNNISKQQVDVELFKLKDRVSQLFYSVLMAQQNDSQFRITANDISARLKNTESGVKYGTQLSNNADMLKAELVNIDQKRVENRYARKSAIDMLAIFTGRNITEKSVFRQTDYQLPAISDTVSIRPELTLYEMQQKSAMAQQDLIKTRELPRLSAFGQAGFGKPGLDYFSNDFKPFYIIGAKASWNLSSFYTTKRELQIQSITSNVISTQRATFDKNSSMQLKQQMDEIQKIQELMKKDEELISIRKRITRNTAVQMENGVITATDYIIALDNQSQAELNLRAHTLLLQLAITNYKNTLGR